MAVCSTERSLRSELLKYTIIKKGRRSVGPKGTLSAWILLATPNTSNGQKKRLRAILLLTLFLLVTRLQIERPQPY